LDSAHNLAGTGNVLLSGDLNGFQLREINTADASTKSAVPIKINDISIQTIQGLGTDPTSGLLWAMATDNSVFASPGLGLIIINPFTGAGQPDLDGDTVIGSAGERFVSISFDTAGRLWGVTDIGADDPNKNTLWQFDKDTGVPAPKCKLNDGLVDPDDFFILVFPPIKLPLGQEKAIGFNPSEPDTLYHITGFSSPIFETIDLSAIPVPVVDPTVACPSAPIASFAPLGPARAITFSESANKFLYVLGGDAVLADPNDANKVFELATDGTISANAIGKLSHSSKGLAFINTNGLPTSFDDLCAHYNFGSR